MSSASVFMQINFGRSYIHANWGERRHHDWSEYIPGRAERDVVYPAARYALLLGSHGRTG